MDWQAKKEQLWDDVEAQLDWMGKHIDELEAENAELTEKVTELMEALDIGGKRQPSWMWWELHYPNGDSDIQLSWKCGCCGRENPMSAHHCGFCGDVIA